MTNIEKKVLGTALMYESAAVLMSEIILSSDIFLDELNKGYYKAICGTLDSPKGYNTTLVISRAKNALKQVEGNEVESYALDLMNYTEAPSIISSLCSELISDYVRRSVNEFGLRLSAYAKDYGIEPPALLDKANEGIKNIENLIGGEDVETIKEQVERTVEQIKIAAENTGLVGYETGLTELDRITGGYQRGHLITIAGRPGMGKSALALKTIVHSCLRGVPCLLFSREMTAEEIVKRSSCLVGGTFNMQELFTQGLSKSQAEYFEKETEPIKQWPLTIDEHSSDLTKVIFEIKRFAKFNPDGIVFIDYIQLLNGFSDKKYTGETAKLTDITRALKQVAKSCNIPIVELSQLNRDVEQRGDKMPMLSDLKQSGSIEEDSNLVIFCYRPEYYRIETFKDGTNSEGLADLLIAKNRSGRTGYARVRYEGIRVKFSDIETSPGGLDLNEPQF